MNYVLYRSVTSPAIYEMGGIWHHHHHHHHQHTNILFNNYIIIYMFYYKHQGSVTIMSQ